jgi:hypothetical protein
MSRPLHHPGNQAPSDDSASFGGLADVLEPDAEAVTSMRGMSIASVREPAPRSSRSPAPIQIQDFAFADTVVASDLGDEPPPPSGPIYVHDPLGVGDSHCLTPLAFPLPPAAQDVEFGTRLRVLSAHMRHTVRRSLEETRELWADTAEMVDTSSPGAFMQVRRVLALWSCFQWSRADFTRAAMIGLAVFITAGAIGATTMGFGDGESRTTLAAASGSEVRPGRTLDQHTGKKLVVHGKR